MISIPQKQYFFMTNTIPFNLTPTIFPGCLWKTGDREMISNNICLQTKLVSQLNINAFQTDMAWILKVLNMYVVDTF